MPSHNKNDMYSKKYICFVTLNVLNTVKEFSKTI